MKKSARLFYCFAVFLAVATVLVYIAGPAAKYAALRSNWLDLGAFQWALFSLSHFGEWQRAFYGQAVLFTKRRCRAPRNDCLCKTCHPNCFVGKVIESHAQHYANRD